MVRQSHEQFCAECFSFAEFVTGMNGSVLDEIGNSFVVCFAVEELQHCLGHS